MSINKVICHNSVQLKLDYQVDAIVTDPPYGINYDEWDKYDNCVSFDKLCKHYGYNRCIGFDLFNPQKHPSVVIKDCELLSNEDNFEIAFCHNDIGSFWHTPDLKLHCQNWAARNIIEGGYFLGNNNYNRPRIELENRMKEYGFKNYQLLDQSKFDHNKTTLSNDILKGYMLSKRVTK